MADAASGRAFVKIDRYASFDLMAALDLSLTEWGVLMALLLLADYRTRQWVGTISDLGQKTRASTNTIRKAVARLIDLGVVEEERPFTRGGNGVLWLSAYDVLVVPERRPPRSLTAALPRGGAKPQVSDLRSRHPARAESDEGVTAARLDPLECVYCGEPADGKAKEGKQACCWRHEEF